MSLVPFPPFFLIAPNVSVYPFLLLSCHKMCETTASLDDLVSVFLPITHSAAAAARRQRQADNACAPDQSHSALSGDAPSALSSHPLFGNLSAAGTGRTPGVVKKEQHLEEH